MSKDKSKPHRVLIVDDHPLVRDALCQLIDQQQDFVVCGEAESVEASLWVIAQTSPKIVIVDLILGAGNGIRLIEELHLRNPQISILVLSMMDESIYAERCLRAGAKGYIMKSEPALKVIEALQKVIAGNFYVSDEIADKMMHSITSKKSCSNTPLGTLTNRELEVLHLVGKGFSPQQIAECLHRSVKTVHAHMDHIKKKLYIRSYRELLVYASTFDSFPGKRPSAES
jgi:DNA-binding NarL/FixJ family response regulator